ncbi:MAG TPA: citrate (Si)-synthase [Candidatus Saccharimonadales bacterium]|nr:citrate (Si)-synthase [Candidatus Saccharimonadales bacterium]
MTGTLRDRLAPVVVKTRAEMNGITDLDRAKVVSRVNVGQLLGGLRGAYGLLCDTSTVDSDRGLIIRGFPIGDLTGRLPEEIFHLLLTGELPDADATETIKNEFRSRQGVPSYVWDVLEALPPGAHPMAMLSTAILSMEKESVFRRRHHEGMTKNDQWEPMLEDALTLLARLPEIAAGIYRLHTGREGRIAPDPSLDWAANFARMLGLPDTDGEFTNLMRLYMVLHCDHEGGNVSAFTSVTVSSALSDLYYALSAGLNGLAGPLHGLANQECLRFVIEIRDHFGGVPSREQLSAFCAERLRAGLRIPGYGHAVLRDTDPRFKAFLAFGKRACASDEVFQIVEGLFETVPKILVEQGKAKDPWPNVDAGSGALLHHFGLTEFDYYTVLFAVSRSLGISAQAVLNRALGSPIMRPKSITMAALRKLIDEA